MTSILQQIFNVGLNLVRSLSDQVYQLCRTTGLYRCCLGVQPKFLISQSSALWGRMVPYPNETCGGDQQGYKYVGFESYLFPVHATAVFARGKYPLLKKRRVILCLSTKQYHGVEMYMAPKYSPLMRLEVQPKLQVTGLSTLLTTDMYYVKEHSMIALTTLF